MILTLCEDTTKKQFYRGRSENDLTSCEDTTKKQKTILSIPS